MCGIVGALNFSGSDFNISEKYINAMRDSMSRRGPDGAGTWIGPGVGLGHRRLSIIDLDDSAGQPMSNEDSSLWIVFNGEIYNHAEIRSQLEKKGGHKWKTDHSDTEMILHAFEEWGIDCIKRFRGMFAMGIWNGRSRKLWLVRDRIGIKPLYYSVHNSRVVFASEIKALLEDPQQKRAVNETAFYDYLSFLAVPAPDTLFDGIMKLEPGTWLCVDERGNMIKSRYWDVLDNTSPLTNASEEEISQMLIKEIRDSVRLRKEGDVPVGVFLSGGVDSSTNVALFSQGEQSRVKAFTIGYEGDFESETDKARAMAQRVGAQYHERMLSVDDFVEFLPEMAYLQDEPIADPTCIPSYYVAKLARDNGVIVCQVGEGADELFWGYKRWKHMLWVHKMNEISHMNLMKNIGMKGFKAIGRKESFYYELLRRGASGQSVFWGGAEAFTESQKEGLLSRRMRSKYRDYTSWEAIRPIRERFEEKAWENSGLSWMTYLDLNMRLPELLLMRLDKMGMGNSVEGRVPFLDHKVVELAMSIPESVKTKKNISKYILKKSVRGIIPDEVIDRKKQGFADPVYEGFFSRMNEISRRELAQFCNDVDFLDRERVMQMLDAGGCFNTWYLLNFALWWKRFIS